MLIGLMISFGLTAIVLRLVASLTPTLEVKDWSTALAAGFVFMVLGMVSPPVEARLLPHLGDGVPPTMAYYLALSAYWFVFHTLSVSITALLLPGMALRGFVGVLVVGALLTAIDLASPYVFGALVASGVPLF